MKLRSSKASMMIEFAIVSVVLYLLLASILTFGRLLFLAQTTSGAIDSAARELARTPFPAASTFEEVRDTTNAFTTETYSEDFLAIVIDPWLAAPGGLTLLEYLDSLGIPSINRQLFPAMYIQRVGADTLLRYPGALVESVTAPSGYSVVVPMVLSQDNNGNMSVRIVRVLEEIDTEEEPGDNTGASPDPFSILSPERGQVALRLNYPFQSVAMQGSINQAPILADDSLVTIVNPGSYTFVDAGEVSGPNAGLYGLGIQLSWTTEIRPFRRVISTQSIYPREVFE